MSRYRLRFLLQELDLQGPQVVIGRSPECQITIEDPLVSRQHARIFIDALGARVVDLGSRNGVRINGSLIRGEAPLRHNDRLRLGTQDLVFLVIDEGSARLTRSTGFMAHCRGCSRPFPGESQACPHCGEPSTQDTDSNTYETITGMPSAQGQAAWTFQLLGEVIERALNTGRKSEAERMMQRAAREVEERTRLGMKLETKHLTKISVFALRLARAKGQPEWAEWALTLHRDHDAMPAGEVLDQLEALGEPMVAALKPLLGGFLSGSTVVASSSDDQQRRLSSRVAALVGS
ncbi:MAG: FHA domain-containing protein [Myxococcales bacterium]